MRDELLAVSACIKSISSILTYPIADLRLFSEDKRRWEITQLERRRIAKYFPILVNQQVRRRQRIKTAEFEKRLPLTASRYMRLQIVNGGDTMQGVGENMGEASPKGGRDNSFVRVSFRRAL